MSYSWNVYKIFSNGKRAKAPIYSFSSNENEINDDYFNNNIKTVLIKKFGSKIEKNKFSVLRSDQPQESLSEESTQERNKKLRLKVFKNKLKETGKTFKNTECALLFSHSTDWKWKWCAVQSATTNIVESISPGMSSYSEAQEWMNEEIKKLQ